MTVEIGVFGGDDCMDAMLRHVIKRDDGIPSLFRREDFVEQFAVTIKDARGRQGESRLNILDGGQTDEDPRIEKDAGR
jgi:hypothetical protein